MTRKVIIAAMLVAAFGLAGCGSRLAAPTVQQLVAYIALRAEAGRP